MEISKRQILGFVGCVLMVVGIFLPVLSFPLVGSTNYFQNGNEGAIAVGILAAVSLVLIWLTKFSALWFTGTGALGTVAFSFLMLVFRISAMKAEMQKDLDGNPFAGIGALAMQGIQIQWGWAVLIIGATLVVLTAVWDADQSPHPRTSLRLAGVAVVLIVASSIAYAMNRPGRKTFEREPSATAPSTKSTDAPHETPEEIEAKAYLPKVKLYQTWGGYSFGKMTCTEYAGRKCASFRAKVKNEGDRPLRVVEVTAYFPDKDDKVVFEENYSPVHARRGNYISFGGNDGPLKPGYVREFGYVVDNCPSECVPKNVRVAVTKVEFYKTQDDPTR
jgi:hypothetical protein